MAIKRDENGIIVQHNPEYPDYADGGDSAARTGIMAMCGSAQDFSNLVKFVTTTDRKLMRHPTQVPYNNPKETSRDQLIQWASGVGVRPEAHYWSLAAIHKYADSNFINKDFLPPDVRLYLYMCAEIEPPAHIKFLGYPLLLLSLIWSCFVRPNNEQNKMVCVCAVMGPWWLTKLVQWHPDLKSNIYNYWSGYPFRDQVEVADSLWTYIKTTEAIHNFLKY